MKQKRASIVTAEKHPTTPTVAGVVATAPAPTATVSDRFMQTLRQTLEHINETEWLVRHSP
ncbi:MAG: hypothetical protein KDE53_23930, partial [Caldilineaceae bacterium]|nr:hypothetical protein [Caldilineaceae bacterium]